MDIVYPEVRQGRKVWARCACGKEKFVRKDSLLAGRIRYCSTPCFHYQQAQKYIGTKFGRLSVESVEKVKSSWKANCRCKCGDTCQAAISDLKLGKIVSCGCYNREVISERMKIVAKDFIGSRNPNWKGDKRRVIDKRSDYGYKFWRKLVIRRDNEVCRVCGSIDSLEAHHLINYASLGPDEKKAIGIGYTMCQKCHIEFHKTFGYRDNSVMQILKFEKLKGVNSIPNV